MTEKSHLNFAQLILKLLDSIAVEEYALGHLINAEAEKIQNVKTTPANLGEVIELQNSVNQIMKSVIKKQIILQTKLELVLKMFEIKPPIPDPPPDIACIKTDKVYESCQEIKMNEHKIDLSSIAKGDITSVSCREVELLDDEVYPIVCKKLPGSNRAQVSFYYRVHLLYEDQKSTSKFVSQPFFYKQTVVMSERIREKEFAVQCEIFLECVKCFPAGKAEIICCVNKLMVFKLTAMVQLLVPEYGFCPAPEPCETHDCTDTSGVRPQWPPYIGPIEWEGEK